MYTELKPESTSQSNAPVPDLKEILAELHGDLTSGALGTRKKAIQTLEDAGTEYLIRKSGDDSLSMGIAGDQRTSILNGKFDGVLLWMGVFRGQQKQCLGTDMVSSASLDRILSHAHTIDSLLHQNPVK